MTGADTIDGTDANAMDSSGIYIEDSHPSEGASQEDGYVEASSAQDKGEEERIV